MAAVLWKYENLIVEAQSLAGIRTAITLPQYSICIDVAQGLPHTMSMKKYFITHAHMDHAAGIPYLISQKNLQNIKGIEFYMPIEIVETMEKIMSLWGELEQHNYDFKFIGLSNNDCVPINNTHFVKAFKSTHRVPTLGYTLFEEKKKLKKEFYAATKSEILQLKEKNIEIETISQNPIFSYTGDTTAEVFNLCPWLLNTKVLFTEVTYLDERKTIEHAKQWGHIHLDEIIPILQKSCCEKIMFCHISSRYSLQEAVQIIRNKLPEDLKSRVEILTGR